MAGVTLFFVAPEASNILQKYLNYLINKIISRTDCRC
jgi:hypothetical protein